MFSDKVISIFPVYWYFLLPPTTRLRTGHCPLFFESLIQQKTFTQPQVCETQLNISQLQVTLLDRYVVTSEFVLILLLFIFSPKKLSFPRSIKIGNDMKMKSALTKCIQISCKPSLSAFFYGRFTEMYLTSRIMIPLFNCSGV